MKRYVLSIATLFLVFLLSGCGGGGSTSTAASNPTTAIEDAELITPESIITDAAGQNFTLKLHVQKNLNGNYIVELNNLDLQVNGCTIMASSLNFSPASLYMDGNALSKKDIDVSGSFTAQCTNTNDYTLLADQKVTFSGQEEYSRFASSSQNTSSGGGTTPPTTGYSFFNAATPLVISQPNATYEIKAQLLKDGFIASGNAVQLMPFSALYGNVSDYSVTTAGDGYAKFNYTSPSVLPDNGTSTTVSMVFTDENNQTYTQNIELNFNTSGSGGTTPYGLVNVSTPIEITAGNQEKNITVYVVETSTNIGVSGKDVTITTIANGMGSVSASTATTDASGKAVFFYRAPASISGLTSTTAKLRFTDNGIISEKEVVINFTPPAGGGTQYSLINETNIVVTAPDSTKDISINLTDTATGIGVPNKDVSITTIDATYGEISVSTVKTDASGKAIFPYTAPATLVKGTINATISFIDDTGTTISKTITITTIAPAGGGTQNAFVNETNLTVTAANTDYQISVDLINSSTGVGVSAEDVSISSIANTYGSISPSISTTNTAGRALFTYTSPITLIAGNAIATVRYTDANGITISKNITITVTPPTGANNQYKLINETTPINITQPSEQKTVSIYVVDSVTGVGIDNKTVTISTLANAYGSFTSSTASTDASGKASFTYIAPSDISGLGTQTATLRFTENGVTLSKDVNFTFNPITGGLSSIDVLPLDSNVSAANEVKSINVYVKDSVGRPVDKASVIVEFFDAKYGTMNTYEDLTDSNGHIEFIYVAPSDIDSLDGQAFDFNISLKSNASITQNVKIGFSKAVNTSPVADIYVAPNDMTIIRAGEVRTFKVTTVDSRNYAVSANLKIENPTQNGVDYGSFDVSDFTTDALGNKIITYTAPASLVGLNDRNITIVELDTNIEKILTLHFQQPATAATSYDLNLSVDSSIAVDSTGTLGVSIHEAGKPNDFIEPIDVISVNATMKFPKMLLFDANQTSTSYSGKNIHSLALFAQHFSGVAVIIVNAEVFNGVSNVTITQEFPVVITSGPVASMSMFHSRNSFDTNSGLYQDFYTIHAVDKYGNPVQEGTALHPTLINGVKEQNITGAIATGTPSIFSDSNADFSTVVDNIDATAGDRLIILPSPGKTSKYYMGDWSVKSHTATTLTLDEQYDDVAETGLSYVVGNESREVTVNGVSLTVTADISSPSDSFQTNAQGNMEFVVSYDPALKGKIFYLAANGPSNTKRIGTALKSSFFYGGYQLRSLINEIKLSNPGDSFTTGFYMLDSTGQTYTGQYNVFIDNFDATKGGFAIDNEIHNFQYFAPSNPDEFNALIGTSYEFNLSVSESEETFETIIVQFTKGTDYTNYAITSTENNFTISQPNQQHGLSFYVNDGTNAVDGANVSVDFIDPLNGSMQTYQAQTNVSGRADFTYIAPSDLALLYANPVIIHAYVSNNRATDINVTALFVPGSVDDYKLTNENNITVNYAGESKEIAVQLIKNGVPQAGETVTANSIPAAYGRIDNASVVTGTDGYARFTYIAADPLTDIAQQPLELLYTDANGAEVTATAYIKVSAQSRTLDVNLTNETVDVNVTRDSQVEPISVYVVDSVTGVGVAGKTVSITTVANGYGSMSSATAVTDAAGKAEFSFQAASDITPVNNTSTTVSMSYTENGASTSKTVTINVNEAVVSSEYNLTNENNITVNYAGESKEIAVQLIKNGVPQAGETVTANSIPAAYGRIDNASVVTGTDGYARFTYIAADSLTDIAQQPLELLYTDANGAEVTATAYIKVSAQVQYKLTNETNISITHPNQVELVSVYVVDNITGVGVSGKTISIATLPAGYGNFNAATAITDASGKAEFSYTAPSDINLSTVSTSLSFIENGVDLSKVISFDYNETTATSEYNLTNANDINISYAGESKEIAVQLIKNGVPQAGENVIAKSIPAIYGTISSASVATGTDGYARFTYIAADPLTDVNTTLELLYTDANGVEVTTTVDINISAQAQIAEYNLTNVTTPITINYDNELKTISVDVIDSNGIGVSGQSVSITSIAGVEFGSIVSDSTTQTDNSGHAFFTYKAPASVADVDGNTTTVTLSMLSNGVSVTSDVSINFAKVDLNVTVPIVVVANQYKEINLTQNSQNVQIEVQVFDQSNNTPYTSGNVKVSLPSEVLTGIDVGSFSEYVVPVASNGKAVFNYTGPQDLQTLTSNGDLNATFQFFHEDNPTQKEDVTVVYDLQAGYIPANYILSTSSSDGAQTMGLEILKSFTLYLKDDQGTLIDDADITSITLVSKNTLIGKLVDAANGGSNESNLTFSGANAVNSKSFSIQTYRISGLLPIEVTVDFNDANGDAQSLTIIMNIVVLSGPPTAMSISYAGVEENSTVAKFTEKFVVTVTDSYNNPVNSQPYVAVGAIVEYAVDGSDGTGTRTTTSPRLWHGSLDTNGSLNTIGGNKAQFETVTNDFSYVDFNNDRLVLFGNGFVYEALGKWDILDSGSTNILDLQDDYNGADRAGLYFAVGHNNRQDLCANDGRQYVGNMKANNYQLDSNGHALVSFEYDYHLTGKDIMVWVNLTGFQADQNRTGRIGESIKHTLRGNGFTSPDEYLIPAGTAAATYRFTVHHATVPEWYRNGHFGFGTQGTCTVNGIVDSSNVHDARDCANTVGYVDLSVSNSGTADCTIKLDSDSIGVSSEFTGVSTY